MQFGFAPIQSEPTFDAMITQARLAEDLGFGTLWVHEHHSQAMMYPELYQSADSGTSVCSPQVCGLDGGRSQYQS